MNIYKNYYKILKISSDANENQIKQAYRELAKKYHPDLNNSSIESIKLFQEIYEAYQILLNNRSDYDQITPHLKEKFKIQFEELDITLNHQLDIKNVLLNIPVHIKYQHYKPCKRCDQTGFNLNTKPTICHICNGSGNDENGYECHKCVGTGNLYNFSCPTCQGKKIVLSENVVHIDEPCKILEDQELIWQKSGNWSSQFINKVGLLKINVKSPDYAAFTRKGYDLHYTLNVDFRDCISGINESITLLDNELINILIKKGTRDKQIFKFEQKGIVKPNQTRGNLYVHVNVIIDYNRMDATLQNLMS